VTASPDAAAAEAQMRAACDAILHGDFMTPMALLTPEAFATAMALAGSLTTSPRLTGYVIDSQEEAAGEHRFRVRFTTTGDDIRAFATWRQLDGVWRITAIGLEQ
jgi:hypothetical protein